MHAGWLSLAAFLNLAQVIVAYRLLPTQSMLGWSLALFAAATVMLLLLNQKMRGNIDYAAAAVWVCSACMSSSPAGTCPVRAPPPG